MMRYSKARQNVLCFHVFKIFMTHVLKNKRPVSREC